MKRVMGWCGIGLGSCLVFLLGMMPLKSVQAGGCFPTNLEGACAKWSQSDPVVFHLENGCLKGEDCQSSVGGGGSGGSGGCSLFKQAQAQDGEISNADAKAMIQRVLDRWKNVPFSSLDIQLGTNLDDGGDVNFENLEDFYIPGGGVFPLTGDASEVDVLKCYNEGQCLNPIILDNGDGINAITGGICGYTFVFGIGGSIPLRNDSGDLASTTVKSGQLIISSACLSPQRQDPACPPCQMNLSLEDLEGVAQHEIGHALGLDHTLVNKDEFLDCQDAGGACSDADKEKIPTMIGLVFEGLGSFLRDLHQDDMSTFATLYPSADQQANTCRITGWASDSTGSKSGRCLEIVARNIDEDPKLTAAATVAGANAKRNDNAKIQSNCDGSLQSCGTFLIKALPPGRYQVDVQVLNNRSAGVPVDPDWDQEPCVPPFNDADYLDNDDATNDSTGPVQNTLGVIQCNANELKMVGQIGAN